MTKYVRLQIFSSREIVFGEQVKFRLQGKFCWKITTTNGSNCNCGLRKQSLPGMIPYGMRI